MNYCNNCIWGDICGELTCCECCCDDYSPVDEEYEEQCYINIIISDRLDYSESWNDYILDRNGGDIYE